MEEKDNVIIGLYNLVYEMLEAYKEEENDPKVEKKSDELYERYFSLIHEHFTKETISEVEKRIGSSSFTTVKFVDTLKEVYQERPRVVDKYKGYVLIYVKSCWGDMEYFVVNEKREALSEAMFFVDDECARKAFRYQADQNVENFTDDY